MTLSVPDRHAITCFKMKVGLAENGNQQDCKPLASHVRYYKNTSTDLHHSNAANNRSTFYRSRKKKKRKKSQVLYHRRLFMRQPEGRRLPHTMTPLLSPLATKPHDSVKGQDKTASAQHGRGRRRRRSYAASHLTKLSSHICTHP